MGCGLVAVGVAFEEEELGPGMDWARVLADGGTAGLLGGECPKLNRWPPPPPPLPFPLPFEEAKAIPCGTEAKGSGAVLEPAG